MIAKHHHPPNHLPLFFRTDAHGRSKLSLETSLSKSKNTLENYDHSFTYISIYMVVTPYHQRILCIFFLYSDAKASGVARLTTFCHTFVMTSDFLLSFVACAIRLHMTCDIASVQLLVRRWRVEMTVPPTNRTRCR